VVPFYQSQNGQTLEIPSFQIVVAPPQVAPLTDLPTRYRSYHHTLALRPRIFLESDHSYYPDEQLPYVRASFRARAETSADAHESSGKTSATASC